MIVLFAHDSHITDKRFDPAKGEVLEMTYNPMQELEKKGIRAIPMPEDHVLYTKKAKGSETPVHMHDQGPFALARVEDGRILNTFNGQRLDRIQFLSWEQVQKLIQIFGGAK